MSLYNMTRATFVEPIHDDDFRSYFATRDAGDSYRFARPQGARIGKLARTAARRVHRFTAIMLEAIATAHARRVRRVLAIHGLDDDTAPR